MIRSHSEFDNQNNPHANEISFQCGLSASAKSTDHGQKRQAPDVLSKYSLRHSVEENAAAAASRKIVELDDRLEKYQNAGVLSRKISASVEEPEVLLVTKKPKNDDSSNSH